MVWNGRVTRRYASAKYCSDNYFHILINSQAYKTWLFNNSCGGANHSCIKVGCSWTAHSMVQEQQWEAINKVIEEEFHEKLGLMWAFNVYQEAVEKVWRWLSEAQREDAEATVLSWNLDRRPPDGVKAQWHSQHILHIAICWYRYRNASHHGWWVFHEFTQEIWCACGMRAVFLVR